MDTAGVAETDAVEMLVGFFNGAATAQAVAVAAELGLCDRLTDGPKTAAALAHAAGCDGPSLRRLLRALAAAGLVSEQADGSFALAAAGELLCSDSSDSLRNWTINWRRSLWAEWGELLHSVRTGEPARKLLRQADGLDHLDHDAEAAGIFDRAMAEMTRFVAVGLTPAYDLSGVRRVVDVGGGHGELLGAVLRAYPLLRGMLYERPHALAGARAHLAAVGVLGRCELVAGDFFESVPAGADAYVLKSIVHDWDDARSATILRNCRSAVGTGGRLLLIEQVMPERVAATPAHRDVTRRDLTMLVGPGGRERTIGEFGTLLAEAGFARRGVVGIPLGFSVIEATPI
jgi:hypothetical protein